MNNNDNSNLYSTYFSAFSNGLTILSESINKSFTTLSDLQLRQETLDILSNSLSQFASVLAHSVMENFDYNILRDSCHQLAMHLSALELPTYNDTTLNTDCISLTDHTVEALSVFLNENAKAPIKKNQSKDVYCRIHWYFVYSDMHNTSHVTKQLLPKNQLFR